MNFIQGRLFFLSLNLFLVQSENIWNPDLTYDFIVVGAGAAGAAVAARLSENGQYQVLLLEAGGEPPFFSQIPYLGMGPFQGKYDWAFMSEKQEYGAFGFKDHKNIVPRGKVLGGTTTINAMMYSRGNPNDYDQWKNLGNDGWGFEDLLPYFKKLEDYQVPLKPEEEIYHNKNGPVTASVADYRTNFQRIIFEAFQELGYSLQDYNSAKQTGYFYSVAAVRNGSRCGTYAAYLEPNRNKPNLHIVTNAFVTKIKFNKENKAVGVYFEKDSIRYLVLSKKEIIISAGSNNSPQLLMLSGIGPKDLLEKHQVTTIINRPGVGENLQEHTCVAGLVFTVNESVGFNFLDDINQNTFEQWYSERKGVLTVPSRFEAIGFLNSRYADRNKDWPDFEVLITQGPLPIDNLKKEYLKPFLSSESKRTITAFVYLMRPKSIGQVQLIDSDPHTPLSFQPNLLKHEDDLNVLLDAVKTIFRIMETKSFSNLGATWHGIDIPGCTMHKKLSDEYLKCYIRHYTFGAFHQSGTCKMGPKNDALAVVDSRLRVYGTSGLRIADVSICPTIISGHTMVPAIMIGEKAAAMILEDWDNHHDEF